GGRGRGKRAEGGFASPERAGGAGEGRERRVALPARSEPGARGTKGRAAPDVPRSNRKVPGQLTQPQGEGRELARLGTGIEADDEARRRGRRRDRCPAPRGQLATESVAPGAGGRPATPAAVSETDG